MSRSPSAALLLAAAACAGCGGSNPVVRQRHVAPKQHAALVGQAADPSVAVPDFALHDQDGNLVRLRAQHGRVVVLTFLYTSCVDVCPLLAANLERALRTLPAHDRAQVRVLAVSVDPKGDTPAAVRRFVRVHRLGPQFRYLTGPHARLARVWQDWNVLVAPTAGERVGHSAFVWILDRRGRTRVSLPSETAPAPVARDLRALLSERA